MNILQNAQMSQLFNYLQLILKQKVFTKLFENAKQKGLGAET